MTISSQKKKDFCDNTWWSNWYNINLSFSFNGWWAIFQIDLATDKQLFNADVGRIGIGICHDIRFPELAALYRENGSPFFWNNSGL